VVGTKIIGLSDEKGRVKEVGKKWGGYRKDSGGKPIPHSDTTSENQYLGAPSHRWGKKKRRESQGSPIDGG